MSYASQLRRKNRREQKQISSAYKALQKIEKEKQTIEDRERWQNTRSTRSRFDKNYVPFEMEFGQSKMTYKGQTCTRSKQYRREGIVN